MSAPMPLADRLLAQLIDAYEEADARDFLPESDALDTMRDVFDILRAHGWIDRWTLTDKGRALVAQLKAGAS